MSKIEVNAIEPQCGTTLTVGAVGTTVAVPSNVVKSNALQASDAGNIISQSGTTITLGATGDSINLASGATQSGFGRTGTVDWQTSIKTATFTAVSGEGYFCNTSGGAFTVNLPSSPSVGDIVAIKDYASSFDTQNLTIGRGGSNMNGAAADSIRNTENESLTLVYADATKGWISVEEGTGFVGETFITATGGTITCCGNYKIHTFTGPGNFCVSSAGVPSNNSIDYLVVAGGGGGNGPTANGGGGGAGGFRLSNSTCMPAPLTSPLANPTGITATVSSFPITIGGGGAVNNSGSSSIFSTITSTGGGGSIGSFPGATGGSGAANGGSGNTPPVSPPQGQPGGPGLNAGGGGAGGAGGAFVGPKTGGVGGIGSFVFGTGFGGCNGTPGPVGSTRYFAGGGAGGYPVGSPSGSPGGAGGGGTGGEGGVPATAGQTNTGGGGGGASSGCGQAGGSGIVIIRYKFQ